MLAALVNRKFTHVVRHIIPGRGWIADDEYKRVCEVEESLNTSVYSAGLNKKPPAPPPDSKPIKGAPNAAEEGLDEFYERAEVGGEGDGAAEGVKASTKQDGAGKKKKGKKKK